MASFSDDYFRFSMNPARLTLDSKKAQTGLIKAESVFPVSYSHSRPVRWKDNTKTQHAHIKPFEKRLLNSNTKRKGRWTFETSLSWCLLLCFLTAIKTADMQNGHALFVNLWHAHQSTSGFLSPSLIIFEKFITSLLPLGKHEAIYIYFCINYVNFNNTKSSVSYQFAILTRL